MDLSTSTNSLVIKAASLCFYNKNDELLFVGKARKIRQRIKKHFEDNVSPMIKHRDEVYKISVCIVEEAMDREIYETYAINTLKVKIQYRQSIF